jgi:hypothetical protein
MIFRRYGSIPHVTQTGELKTPVPNALRGHAFKRTYGSDFGELKTDVFRSRLFGRDGRLRMKGTAPTPMLLADSFTMCQPAFTIMPFSHALPALLTRRNSF